MKVLGKNISLWSTIRGKCKQLECSSMSIHSGCYKIPEIGWPWIPEVYFLTVLEADRLADGRPRGAWEKKAICTPRREAWGGAGPARTRPRGFQSWRETGVCCFPRPPGRLCSCAAPEAVRGLSRRKEGPQQTPPLDGGRFWKSRWPWNVIAGEVHVLQWRWRTVQEGVQAGSA